MLRTMILVIAMVTSFMARAQSDLQIGSVLGGKYVNDPSVTEITISGDNKFLKDHRLTNFVSFKGDAAKFAPKLQPLVLADGTQATARNVRYADGKLQYAFFMLKPTGTDRTINRYIFYIYNSRKKPAKVMLIYMEGTLSRSEASNLIQKDIK